MLNVYVSKQDLEKARKVYDIMLYLFFQGNVRGSFTEPSWYLVADAAVTVNDDQRVPEICEMSPPEISEISWLDGRRNWMLLWRALNRKYGRKGAMVEYEKRATVWKYTHHWDEIPKYHMQGGLSINDLCS
jgi:hypothetical protein